MYMCVCTISCSISPVDPAILVMVWGPKRFGVETLHIMKFDAPAALRTCLGVFCAVGLSDSVPCP